jgi:uncharacterized protein YgiM (DUF1202 family)
MNRAPAAAFLLILPALAISCSSATPITPAAQDVKPVTATPVPAKTQQQPQIVVQPPQIIVQQPPQIVHPAPYYQQPTSTAGGGYYSTTSNVIVRTGPGTSYARSSSVAAGDSVYIYCQTHGEQIQGPAGASDLWDRTGPPNDGYVSDEFVATGTTGSNSQIAPSC